MPNNSQIIELLAAVPTVDSSIGVHVDSTGTHRILRCGRSEVYAAEITFTSAGETLLAKYKSDYSQPSGRASSPSGNTAQIKNEAYILSQAESYEAFEVLGTHTTVIGDPLHYGWHFNWNGSEAICITHEPIRNGTIHEKWICRKYKMTVTESEVSGEVVLESTVAIEETVDWYPLVQRINIWTPGSDGSMSYMSVPGCNTLQLAAGYGEHSYEVPLYGFYRLDGTEEIITYKHDWLGTKTLAELEQEAREDTCHCYGYEFLEAGSLDAEYEGYTGAAEVEISTTSGLSYSGIFSTGGLYKRIKCEAPAYNYESPSEQAPPYSAGMNAYTRDQHPFVPVYRERYKYRYADVRAEYWDSQNGTSSNTRSSNMGIIIPFHSSESAYIGKLDTKAYDLYIQSRRFLNGTQVAFRQYADGVVNSPWIGVYFPVYNECTADIEASCDSQIETCFNWAVNPSDLIVEAPTPPAPEWELQFGLVTTWESETLVDLVTDDSYSLGQYLNFLNPPACGAEPVTLNRVQNYQSTLGNSVRIEDLIDSVYGSNNLVTPEQTEPYGLWLGRS